MTTLRFDEIGDGDRPRVGGKAFVLARLRREGLPVPDGFVLVAGEGLDESRRAALVAAYARLGGAVAVRSSSTAEDLEKASFAGQYRTFLDVWGEDAVVGAALACLASAADGRPYARAVGAPESAPMAVLVQRFVEPRAAGVVFTRHPHDPGAMLVESHGGRGEVLVSGAVTPDAHVLDRETGAVRSGPADSSLAEADLLRVAELARRVETLLGGAQDVEWAIGPEGAVVLQARPITVEAEERADPSARRLTRANVGEVMPDPVTPLTWSTVCGFLEHGFRDVARRAGVLPPGAGSFLVLHRSRLYLNLTLCLETGLRLPGISRADAERLILGGGAKGGPGVLLRPSALPALAAVALRLAAMARRLPSEIDSACALVEGLPDEGAIEGADAPGLVRLLGGFVETGRIVGSVHIATSGSSALRLALLGQVLERWSLGDAADLVNRLVAGLPGVASAAPAIAIESLAAEARQRGDWSDWLRQGADDAARGLAEGAAPPGLAARLSAFLQAYGHRAISEGDLAASSWQDDPAPLFEALRPLLASARSAGFGQRARAEARRADEEALFSRLGLVRRAVFGFLLTGAQAWVRERERTKSAAVALVNHGRRITRVSARRLVASGTLGHADDVHFLTLAELVGALEGEGIPAAAVARRRRIYEREGRLPAPREVDLGAREVVTEEAQGELAGIGVSAGVGAGPARVLRAGEPPRIEPGEVLIAPVLDAALGPLLASASAAVAEIGGMLSHGSVVARELGVPCVVDVRDATRRIRTGERVLVDGGTGRVSVLEDETPGVASARGSPRLAAADAADERLHPPESHPFARESVYFNAQDPASGLRVIATAGVRRGVRGEAVVALALPDGRVLFGLDLSPPRTSPDGFSVGGTSVHWMPTRLRFDGRLAAHEDARFPPWPLPLLLEPLTVAASIDLVFHPTTPAVDLCEALSPEARQAAQSVGRHHVEQSGRWRGEVRVGPATFSFDGTGSRDHSWGLRDWRAYDHSRLFTLRLGDDMALHALAMGAQGRRAEGGFLWTEGRLETITRVEWAAQRDGSIVRSFELEVTTADGTRLGLRGFVERTLTIPVQLEKRPSRLLAGHPYRLLLHEGFTRYEAQGRVGFGIAEVSERPR